MFHLDADNEVFIGGVLHRNTDLEPCALFHINGDGLSFGEIGAFIGMIKIFLTYILAVCDIIL